MRGLIIVIMLFLTSCSSKVLVNGVEVRQPNTSKQKDANVLLFTFVTSYAIMIHFYNPHKK